MPASDPVLLSDCRIWLGGYDLSPDCRQVGIGVGRQELPNGRFGDTVSPFFPGVQTVDVTVGGFYSAGSALDIDPAVWPRLDPAVTPTEWPLTFAPPFAPAAAAGAFGNVAYTARSCQFAYKISGKHGDLLPFDLTSRVKSGALYRQTVEAAKALVAATTTTAGTQLGLVGATQKHVAALHIFAITGGSWVLTIESDDNSGFTTPTVRATFTAVTTAPNRQVVETVGPIATDNYWRGVLTKAGGTNITWALTQSIENA